LNDFKKPWNDELIFNLVSKNNFSVRKVQEITNERIVANKVNIISAERLSGHPYSCGYDAELIMLRIKECFPDGKIIIVQREVKSFTLSVYKQMVKEGYCGKLKDFLDTNDWKSNQNRTKYLSQQPLINSYLSKFDSVLILSFEDLISNKPFFFNSISQFINVSLEKCIIERLNPTWKNRRINALRALNKFRKTELNKFPIIDFGDLLIRTLASIAQYFYTNRIK
jgi:c-di-GMP-related signal transduction protein